MDFNSSPDYLKAADLHNIGAGNTSFFSDPIQAISEDVDATANFVSKIPDFAITSVASGINSIYNSAVVAGNFFGISDAKENDLQQTLGSYDTNLGDYYSAHKQAVDTAGFIASSFIPGTAGVKLINAGQRLLVGALKTGGVAAGLAEATGLATTLSGTGETLTTIAGQALAKGNQTFTVMNAGVVKALAGGVAQAAIDSFGFEAMVQATMFRSPILEGQDIKDIGSNLLTATVFGGAVGGLINAAGVYGGITKILNKQDEINFPYKSRGGTAGLVNPADRAVVALNDLKVMPEADTALAAKLAEKKTAGVWQDVRTETHELTSGDKELGNVLGDAFEQMGPDQSANVLAGARSIMRPGFQPTAGEGHTIGYAVLHGVDDVGNVSFEAPRAGALTFADKIPGGRAAIDSTVASYKYTDGKLWSPITAPNLDSVEARYIWAKNQARYADGMVIHQDDIPLLEGSLDRGLGHIVVTDGKEQSSVMVRDLQNFVIGRKQALADEIHAKIPEGWGFGGKQNVQGFYTGTGITSDDIAKSLNVSTKFLESDKGASAFARQDAQKAYDDARIAAGKPVGEVSNLDYIPKHAAIAYDTSRAAGNSDVISAMINVKQVQKIQKEAADRAFGGIAGSLNDRFIPIADKISGANRSGAGAGILTSSNAAFGSLGSSMEYIGKATADLITQIKKSTSDVVESVALRLRSDQQGAIEFSKLNDLRNSTTEHYVLNDAQDGLIAKSLKEFRERTLAGEKNVPQPELQAGAPGEIKFVNQNAGDAIRADIQANGARVQQENALRQAEGSEGTKNPDRFYGWKPDARSMPFFAFVKDESLTGTAAGHTSMIHADSAEKLSDMIDAVRAKTGFKVYTKKETEDFFKAQKDYEFDRTLHENYIDSSLKSAGIDNNFFPKSNPDTIVDEWLASHSRRDASLARDAVAVKYGNEFDQLEALGNQYTGMAASRTGGTTKAIENTVQNPYNDYRKTALNISRLGEYPLLSSVNRGLESAVSGVIGKIQDAWSEAKSVGDLERVNGLLKEAGISHAYGNAAEMMLANHTAPKPYLSNFIRGANTILANTFLRLDFLNPIANAVGAQVLLGHETSGQVKALLRDVNAAGVQVPGTTDNILSATKMVAKANADYLRNTPELDQLFKHNALTISTRDQMKSMLDDISAGGLAENQAQSQTWLNSAFQKAKDLTDMGEKLTGNKMAEEYNRFVAAHVAKQIHDVRVAAGLASESDLGPFMNTFVNRTQTNTLASQRPLLFQGPVGQAIGLFQSFQFNTMQQLFRGISEGGAKDAAMAMGLQGTLFGLNGLPAFQYINQHIIGTASGNPNHTDAYSTLYGAAGKTAGDWLMYGIPSNLLQTNIYSRGDINPRTLTVVPVAPQDIVAVSAFSKFAGDVKDTLGKIAGGGDVWQSVLQGLEHNGLSRPLAGLAQTLQATGPTGKVYSTTNRGDISFVNDFMSLATLSRLAGGKPLDEAIANDEAQRALVYQADSHARMKQATETFKTTVIGDPTGTATPQAVHNYMADFVKNGGRAEQFNQNMLNIITKANTPRANQIMATLKGPYAGYMKDLMGGAVEDLNSQ